MKKLLVIDACVREESRTKRIGTAIIKELETNYSVETVDLTDGRFLPVDSLSFGMRGKGVFTDEADKASRQFAQADLILLLAPFWDMSFPASVKAYFERISLPNITFVDGERETRGICRAQSILYVTTRGMDIPDGHMYEQGSPYIKAFAHLCGIPKVDVISAYNMDYVSKQEQEEKINEAVSKGREICRYYLA